MYAVTVVLPDAEEAERARMINLRATAAEESKVVRFSKARRRRRRR